jgi:hypothetical protein
MMHTVDDHEGIPFKVEEDQQRSAPNNARGRYFSPLCMSSEGKRKNEEEG